MLAAQSRPKAIVSSGLFEMNVAMSGQWTDSFVVAKCDAGSFNCLSDASEFCFWELVFPGVEQGNGIAAGDGEKQFVILAIGQCGHERGLWLGTRWRVCFRGCTDGDGGRQEFGTAAAGFHEVAQVGGEAIAQINHRMRQEMPSQPSGFLETRGEVEVFAVDGTAKFAGDKNGVAEFAAGSQNTSVFCDCPDHRHGKQEERIGRGFAADDGGFVCGGDFCCASVNVLNPIGIKSCGKPECDQGMFGFASHGGDIAQTTGNGFAPNFLCRCGRGEVCAFDNGVGLE